MPFTNQILSPYPDINDSEYKKILDWQENNDKAEDSYNYSKLNEGVCVLCRKEDSLPARKCLECTQLLCSYHYSKHLRENHDTFFCIGCGTKLKRIDVWCLKCNTYQL